MLKRGWRRFFLVSCLSLLLPGGCVSQTQTLERSGKAQEKYFDISGQVVDEDGQLLDNVRQVYSFSSHRGWDEKTITDKQTRLISGNFHVIGGPAQRVGMTFRKQGYYSESLTVSNPDAAASFNDQVLRGRQTEPEKIERKNVTITMFKQGPLVHMRSTPARLEYRTDRSGTVLDFKLPDLRVNIRKVEDVETLTVNEQYPVMFICVEHQEDVTTLPAKIFTIYHIAKESDVAIMPHEMSLQTTDLKGGFIPVVLDPDLLLQLRGVKLLERVAILMREAPENGYRSRWILTPQMLEQPVFFYFKLDGKYGRGWIKGVDMIGGDQGVVLSMELVLPVNGGRNLERGSW